MIIRKVIKKSKFIKLIEKIYGKEKPTIYDVSNKEKLFIDSLYDSLESIEEREEVSCDSCIHKKRAQQYGEHNRCAKRGYFKDADKCEHYKERIELIK